MNISNTLYNGRANSDNATFMPLIILGCTRELVHVVFHHEYCRLPSAFSVDHSLNLSLGNRRASNASMTELFRSLLLICHSDLHKYHSLDFRLRPGCLLPMFIKSQYHRALPCKSYGVVFRSIASIGLFSRSLCRLSFDSLQLHCIFMQSLDHKCFSQQ